MNISKLLVFIPFIFLSGCVTRYVVKVKPVYPEISELVYSSCNKPSSIENDLGVLSKSELEKLSNKELDKRILKAYNKTKQDHLACYKTVVNLKKFQKDFKNRVDEEVK